MRLHSGLVYTVFQVEKCHFLQVCFRERLRSTQRCFENDVVFMLAQIFCLKSCEKWHRTGNCPFPYELGLVWCRVVRDIELPPLKEESRPPVWDLSYTQTIHRQNRVLPFVSELQDETKHLRHERFPSSAPRS